MLFCFLSFLPAHFLFSIFHRVKQSHLNILPRSLNCVSSQTPLNPFFFLYSQKQAKTGQKTFFFKCDSGCQGKYFKNQTLIVFFFCVSVFVWGVFACLYQPMHQPMNLGLVKQTHCSYLRHFGHNSLKFPPKENCIQCFQNLCNTCWTLIHLCHALLY